MTTLQTVRAALCALNQSSIRQAQAINIHKLRYIVQQMGMDKEIDYKQQLGILNKLGLVQKLKNGYYLVLPTRCVVLQHGYLLLSALPDQELARLINIRTSLVGYVYHTQQRIADMPEQTLNNWLGYRPHDLLTWCLEQYKKLNFSTTTLSIDQVEVYGVEKKKKLYQAQRWTSLNNSHLNFDMPLYCRIHLGASQYSYVFVTVQNGKITQEANSKIPHQRLLYALDKHLGLENNYQLNYEKDNVILTLPNKLPCEEYRFLFAISEKMAPGKYRFKKFLQADMLNLLHQLGYKDD